MSTSHLPTPEVITALVTEAHARYKSNTDGNNSEVYPALARVPRELFGVCVVGTSGSVYAVGDTDYEFTIMSVSKPFVFALVVRRPVPSKRAKNSEQTPPVYHSIHLLLSSGGRWANTLW